MRTLDYARGEALLSDLLARPDLDADVRVRVLHALGIVHWVQTHYARALSYCQQFYELAHAIGDRVYEGGGLLNMGLIYHETGYYDQALDLFMRSLQIFQDMDDSYREARALWHVGLAAMQLGRWDVAERHFDLAIERYRSLSIDAPLANLYWCRGSLSHLLGDEAASEAAYRQGLAIAQAAEHGHPKAALDNWLYLGLLYQTQARWQAALECYDHAASLAQQLNNQHLLALTLYRRGNVFQHQGQLDDALQSYRDAIDLIENLRGATEDEMIKIGLLGTTQQVYEAMVLLCLACERPVEAFEYVERARSRAFLDTLTRKSPELYDAVAQAVATMPEIQSRLPADALLVEYFTTGVVPRGEHLLNKLPPSNTRLREQLLLPPHVLIFAIAREQVEVYQAALDPNTLRPLPNDPGPGRRLLHGRMLPQLYERLIAPISHLLAGRELLYVIPHGPLHYVPFQALRSADGAYLIDNLMLARAPSATILLRNCLGRHPSRAKRVVALGYNDQGDAALLHAEAEARSVAQLLDGEAWTGSSPKSRLLLEQGREMRWLHVACHAVFKPGDPLDSELRLGEGDALSARTIIGELDLGVDLVALSACTSGLSQVVSGDELLGLQRACLYAGAPTVVCTLWEAADLVTRFVMERFYTDL
ncbi:MAG TPA: CHAT domain-containing protein, partial [Herpetosiphonaceae bacterium]